MIITRKSVVENRKKCPRKEQRDLYRSVKTRRKLLGNKNLKLQMPFVMNASHIITPACDNLIDKLSWGILFWFDFKPDSEVELLREEFNAGAYVKMKSFTGAVLPLFVLLFISCCQDGNTAHSQRSVEPDHTPGLLELKINDTPVYVDIAMTGPARHQGLMYVKSLPENEGMIFVYPESDFRSFWMKNTLIPLSLAYIDENGVIFQIIDMKPHDENGHPSDKPAVYVLEVNKGWFDKKGIKKGDTVTNLPDPRGAE